MQSWTVRATLTIGGALLATTALATEVFISELHYDNAGADTGERVELIGPAGADATGWQIVFYNGNGGADYATVTLSGSFSDFGDGRGAIVVDQAGIQNGSPDGLALVDPRGLVTQFLSYEGTFTATAGPASGRVSVDIGVSESSSTPAGSSLQVCPVGWLDPQPNTFGAPNACDDRTPAAEIVINEIMQNPGAVSDGAGEWLELFNPNPFDVDLNRWTIADEGSDSHTISEPLLIPAGGYLVLGRNTDPATNGGAAVDYSYGPDWFLGNSADEVVLKDPDNVTVDRVAYDGGGTFPDPTGASMALLAADVDNADGANWCVSQTSFGDGDFGTPGRANRCGVPAFIHEVQGSGESVVAPGLLVEVQGVVTADLQGDNELRGFFIQEEDADADTDPLTSEAIFVFCGGCETDVAEGDLVSVTGEQEDFFGMSQLDSTEPGGLLEVIDGAAVSGADYLGAVSATPVDLPAAGRTDDETTFEAVEAMLVSFRDTLTVTEFFQLGRFGQAVLSAGGRQRQFTDRYAPSVDGFAEQQEEIGRNRIILDDLNNRQNVDPVFHPQPGGFAVDNFFRGGDSVENLVGVLHWSFAGAGGTDAWRIRPTEANPVSFSRTNPRTERPLDVGGRLAVASLNVLNYFDTIDEGDAICGPAFDADCRGASSVVELERQTDKLVSALAAMNADVVGLIEIENNENSSLDTLVAALNDVVGNGTYAYVDTGTIGSDAIKVALIYKPDTVNPVGPFAILDSSVDERFIDTRNRPVLVQTFAEAASGERVTIAVNHFKSKGSSCADVGDPDRNDGQGNCAGTRAAAAAALAEYLASDPTGAGDPDYLVIGDLNAYALEDAITAFTRAGYEDLLNAFEGDSAYTFVFDGQWGYLDHALANRSLTPQVTGATIWHINADEVNLLDYNDTVEDPAERSFEVKPLATELYAPDAYRSSDHDPVIVGLALGEQPGNKDACKNGGWQALLREDGTRFRNQGLCIKYVNTGR